MNPLLLRESLHAREQAELRALLRLSPWPWPNQEPWKARASAVAELDAPPSLRPGDVALLSANEPGMPEGAGLWLLRISPGWTPSSGPLVSADQAWSDAKAAVATALPVLWKDARPVLGRKELPPVELVEALGDHWPSVLAGGSFGLSLTLALASELLELPIPPTVVATACVNANGSLAPVRGLPAKIRLVAERAPGVTRLLVCDSQAAEASSCWERLRAPDSMDVVGVATAAQAVELAFPQAVEVWRRRGLDPALRSAGARSLFLMALSERACAPDWSPVRRAARVAIESWEGVEEDDAFRLHFCDAVAARHQGESVPLRSPGPRLFKDLPQPLRLDCIAHVVQHAADTGTPEPDPTLELGRGFLVEGPDAFPQHLKLMGSLGRLLATMVQPADALEMQLMALQGWIVRPCHQGASYPLAEAYRLAGALEELDAFDAISDMDLQLRSRLRAEDRLFVDNERACALARLARRAEARPLLESAWSSVQIPFLRYRAGRHLLLLERSSEGHGDVRAAVEAAIQAGSQPGSSGPIHYAHRTGLLCELDTALASGELEHAIRLADQLEQADPGLIATMHRFHAAVSPGWDWPHYLCRFYPY